MKDEALRKVKLNFKKAISRRNFFRLVLPPSIHVKNVFSC